jgi:hypothetical protein
MKQFSLIYKDETPFLRQRNPLIDNRNLVSVACYEEHERAYIAEAIKVLNPVSGQREYFGSELEMFWRFTEDGGQTWIETSEPNFIGTSPENYEQVFKVKPRKLVPYQERVKDWIIGTFGEGVIVDMPERLHRFIEEAIELAQALEMPKDDIIRQIVRTYSRPSGEPFQEIGGVMVTLNGLATAAGIDVLAAAETELSNNIKNASAIREKWLNKIAISPLK